MREELKQRGSAEWDLITLKGIPAGNLAGEAELYGKKWFDYRRVHPMCATFEFIDCYTEAHRHQYARRLDLYEARALRFDAMQRGEHQLLAFWQGRRAADALGMRYNEFTMYACDMAERCWKHLARPVDLTNSFLLEGAQEYWVTMLSEKIIYPEDDFYQIGNWCGHRDQVAWQEFVSLQLTKRVASLAIDWNAKLGKRGYIRQSEPHGSA